MRLTDTELQAFSSVIAKYLKSPAELRLFGSRADDNARGGDIDLLLVLPGKQHYQQLAFYKSDILAEIKTLIGDQKIDLIMATQDAIKTNAFLQSVYPASILLKSFS